MKTDLHQATVQKRHSQLPKAGTDPGCDNLEDHHDDDDDDDDNDDDDHDDEEGKRKWKGWKKEKECLQMRDGKRCGQSF